MTTLSLYIIDASVIVGNFIAYFIQRLLIHMRYNQFHNKEVLS